MGRCIGCLKHHTQEGVGQLRHIQVGLRWVQEKELQREVQYNMTTDVQTQTGARSGLRSMADGHQDAALAM